MATFIPTVINEKIDLINLTSFQQQFFFAGKVKEADLLPVIYNNVVWEHISNAIQNKLYYQDFGWKKFHFPSVFV